MKNLPNELRDEIAVKKLIDKGDAMLCPTCGTAIMKDIGCDWIMCLLCKTEICWVTRGPRWGAKVCSYSIYYLFITVQH